MQLFSSHFQRLLALVLGIVLSTGALFAQVTERSGTMNLVEGRRYMVAFPQVWASPTEKPLPQPMVLFISSKSKASVVVSTPAAINSAPRINRTFNLEPNKVLVVPISTTYMNEENESRLGLGISVIGSKPISVSTYQAWQGNGELARHLPTEAWGKNYYSMNFYQDRYGASLGYKYRPSQIVVVASKDNTVVTYTPTFNTEGGRDNPSVVKGASASVTLEKGETYLIRAKINENFNKDFRSDLSGTLIKASKPIGVISGHTKVAIMRYPDVLPPSGMFAAEAHFVRSNVHDAMLPIEMAGTKFITVPCKYTASRVTGVPSTEFGIDDDRGDVIRVVATEDDTKVWAMRQDGTELKAMYTLRKGETRVETPVADATYWVSDKPILMGQYGKSYAKILPPVVVNKDGGNVQGHPTVEAGMPMLQYIPSIDRWVDYSVFKSPEGMDNFFNIVFKEDEIGLIKVDGKALNSAFGGSMRRIPGTPYAYIATTIGVGDHVVESVSPTVKYVAWSYGSLDGLQMGRAYGTPVAIDLSIPCDDSLAVTEQIVCGDVVGVGKILPENTTCGMIFAVYADELNNYEFIEETELESDSKVATFRLNVIDKTKDASGKVLVVSRSGKFVEKTYTYVADKISWDPEKVDFGSIPFNTPMCKEVTLTNKSADKPVNVLRVFAKHYPGVYTFNPPGPFIIAPGGSQKIDVCAVISDTREKLDTMIADLECYPQPTTELRVRGDEPFIYVGEQTWVDVPASSPGVQKSVEIVNGGKVDLIITGYDKSLLDGTGNFFNPVDIDNVLPLTLKAHARHIFKVTYSPKGDAVNTHVVNVPFYSNAVAVDSIAVLTGNGVTMAVGADVEPWVQRVIDNIQVAQGIARYNKTLTFYNTGVQVVEFAQPMIRGVDASSFVIVDNGTVGTFPIQLGLASGGKTITVAFIPTEIANRGAERNNYSAEVVFNTTSNGVAGEVVVPLFGTAWQPQVKGADQDYGVFNIGDASLVIDIPIVNENNQGLSNPTTGDAKGTHDVVITDILIKGAVNGFRIENAPTAANPWRVSATDVINLQVRFTPTVSGVFSADYEIVTLPTNLTDGAATYTPVYKLTASVIGGEFMVEGDSADQYVFNEKELIVKVRHTEGATRRYTVAAPAGPDALRFTIIEPATGSMDIDPGQEGIIRVSFVPDYVTKMNAGQTDQWLGTKGMVQGLSKRADYFVSTIDVTDVISGKVQTARVAGHGIYLETTNFIKDDYVVDVSKSIDIAVELRGVPEAIQNGGVTQLRTRMSYDNTLLKPRTNLNDIVLTGMQAEGWTVVAVDQVTSEMIQIDIADRRATPVALTNASGAPVFKVTFDSYLAPGKDLSATFTSPLNVYSYWVDHNESGERKDFTVIRDIPGKVVVNQNCAKGIRIISISATNFAVQPISPNPVVGSAVINYSIGLEGDTRIALFNSNGQHIMDLVSERQAVGSYELTVDVSTLPAGTYFFRVISGPYTSETQVLTIVH